MHSRDSADPIEQMNQRIEALEVRCDALVKKARFWMASAAVLVMAGLLIVIGAAVPRSAAGQDQKPRDVVPRDLPRPVEPRELPPGIDIKQSKAEQFILQSHDGKTLAALSEQYLDGSVVLSLHRASDQGVRLWLRVGSDGEPGIIFFDKDGRKPYELYISRTGKPSLELREASLGPRK